MPVADAIQRHMIVGLEKSKLQKMWKAATVALFAVLLHLPVGIEKTTRNLCHDNWPESQNLNEGKS